MFYKKALGRGKSITHLFPEEEQKLADLLLKANAYEATCVQHRPYKPRNPKKVIFDLTPTANGEVSYEKILEGWIIQNIDEASSGMNEFLGDLNDIECFANYVPVSIAGGNLDVVVLHREKHADSRYRITLIELKRGIINNMDVEQTENYVQWAFENLTKRIVEKPEKIEIDGQAGIRIIQPVIIGKGVSKNAADRCNQYRLPGPKPILVKYDVDKANYRINFSKVSTQRS